MDSETKKSSYFPNFIHVLGLLFLALLISFLVFIIKKLLSINNPDYTSIIILFTSLMTKIILILISLWIMRKRNNDKYKLQFKRVDLPSLLVMIPMGISILIITTAITRFLPPMPIKLAELFRRIYQPNIYTLIRVIIFTPILEEIFFRGIILEGFLKNYSPAKAIILSAIVFGIFHLNPWQAISATLLGIFIGWAYWKTNSLIPGLMLHCLNNSIISVNSLTHFMSFQNKTAMLILLIIAIILIMTGYKILNQRLKSLIKLNENKDGS